MEWMCRTLHTPNTFPACLIEHLVNSGRGALVTQLIEHMTCLQLSQGLQSNQQTMQVVYHAKQSMCASHKTSLSMFSSLGLPQSIHSHEVHINNLQEVVQSAGMHPDAIFTQWPNFSMCEGSGAFKKIMSNTLECAFFFADTLCQMATNISKVEILDITLYRN